MDASTVSQWQLHGVSLILLWHAAVKGYEVVRDNGGIKGMAQALWRGKYTETPDGAPQKSG